MDLDYLSEEDTVAVAFESGSGTRRQRWAEIGIVERVISVDAHGKRRFPGRISLCDPNGRVRVKWYEAHDGHELGETWLDVGLVPFNVTCQCLLARSNTS
jgi:hypothetical protein